MTGPEALVLLPAAAERLLADVFDLVHLDVDCRETARAAAERLEETAAMLAPLVALAHAQAADQPRLALADADAERAGRTTRRRAAERADRRRAEDDGGDDAIYGSRSRPSVLGVDDGEIATAESSRGRRASKGRGGTHQFWQPLGV